MPLVTASEAGRAHLWNLGFSKKTPSCVLETCRQSGELAKVPWNGGIAEGENPVVS